jgi:hypothetical protein
MDHLLSILAVACAEEKSPDKIPEFTRKDWDFFGNPEPEEEEGEADQVQKSYPWQEIPLPKEIMDKLRREPLCIRGMPMSEEGDNAKD